ncbi:Ulp1-like peptidase [Cucumis melo var. makuwa]|uniref:Ulp1-like peptidase n=1 Tax=Cucumis melo var. makuwa TaxID=1194695 RepID=A0A5A7TS12_CUCMM|nr:Ulp1-like peptidase [Cucumis melo var. makuwa]
MPSAQDWQSYKDKLTKEQLQMFDKTIFGPLLNVNMVFNGQLIHHFLLRQIPEDGNADGVCFSVLGKNVRFTQKEFNIITRCGLMKYSQLQKNIFDNKNIVVKPKLKLSTQENAFMESRIRGDDNMQMEDDESIRDINKNDTNTPDHVRKQKSLWLATVTSGRSPACPCPYPCLYSKKNVTWKEGPTTSPIRRGTWLSWESARGDGRGRGYTRAGRARGCTRARLDARVGWRHGAAERAGRVPGRSRGISVQVRNTDRLRSRVATLRSGLLGWGDAALLGDPTELRRPTNLTMTAFG